MSGFIGAAVSVSVIGCAAATCWWRRRRNFLAKLAASSNAKVGPPSLHHDRIIMVRHKAPWIKRKGESDVSPLAKRQSKDEDDLIEVELGVESVLSEK